MLAIKCVFVHLGAYGLDIPRYRSIAITVTVSMEARSDAELNPCITLQYQTPHSHAPWFSSMRIWNGRRTENRRLVIAKWAIRIRHDDRDCRLRYDTRITRLLPIQLKMILKTYMNMRTFCLSFSTVVAAVSVDEEVVFGRMLEKLQAAEAFDNEQFISASLKIRLWNYCHGNPSFVTMISWTNYTLPLRSFRTSVRANESVDIWLSHFGTNSRAS